MKSFNKHIGIKSIVNKLKRKVLSIVLAVSLIFSCFAPATSAFAKTAETKRNIDSMIARKASALTAENNYLLGQSIVPEKKIPLVNPFHVTIDPIFKKVWGSAQKNIEKILPEVLNWILGEEPSSKKDPDEKLNEIKKSVAEVDKTVKECHDETMKTLKEMMEERVRDKVADAIKVAKTLFDENYKSPEIWTINDNIKSYNDAEKSGDKQGMIKALEKIAVIDGVSQVKGDSKTKLEESYLNLYLLSVDVGGSSDLKNLFEKTLKSKKDVNDVIKAYNSLYYPFVKYMDKINEYQVISLTALREHERICNPEDKLLKNHSDQEISNAISRIKSRTPGVMKSLESINNRILNIPNLTMTLTYSNGVVQQVRYHSLGDAWVDAQRDNVTSAKITLYSDYVYNGEDKNFFGDVINPDNRNMKFDLTSTQYGKESEGFFKWGSLNVKSGKNIQLDLNSHVLANLQVKHFTVAADKDATLTLINTTSEKNEQTTKGQVGALKYETGSAGSVHNVKFADKYSFKKFDISQNTNNVSTINPNDKSLKQAVDQRPKNDQETNAGYKYEYKDYKDVKGQERSSAAIFNGGATKNFEINGCDFIGLENKSATSLGGGIDMYSELNLTKTDAQGNVTNKCAGIDIKDCSFIDCKARKGAAISTTKHLNVTGCVFDGCETKEDGGAIFKYTIEGDTIHMSAEEQDVQFDKEDSTFSNSKFNNNQSDQGGGSIWILGNVDVQNCSFSKNKAAQGGAIYETIRQDKYAYDVQTATYYYHYFGDTKLTNSSFDNNAANKNGNIENNGGAVCVDGGKAISNGSKFTNNSAKHDGGAVCQMLGKRVWASMPSDINNTTFSQNKAENDGGAIKLNGKGTFNDVKLTNNYAQNCGGGAYCETQGTKLEKTTITDNKCKNGRGAGIFVKNEVFLYGKLTIKDNFMENGEKSNLRVVDLKNERISPEWGFYQGGSYVGLDLKGQSNIITDKKTKTRNKDWVHRITEAKKYLHMDDGRSVDIDTWGTCFWQQYWLKAC